jgi:hypothetical protein
LAVSRNAKTVDVNLVADRARVAGLQRVEEAARTRLHARYARLLADGQAANPPHRPAADADVEDVLAVRPPAGC